MARISEVYSKYIKAPALKKPDGSYGTMLLTIAGSRISTFDDGTKQIACSFEEDDRELGFNVTMADFMEKWTGSDDSEKWHGVRVELYVDENVKWGRDTVHAVRVRKPTGAAPSKPAQSQASSGGPPSTDGPPDSIPADPMASVVDKGTAWKYFGTSLKKGGKSDDDIKAHWVVTVKGIAATSGRTETQFTADDWRNVAEAADIPF